MRKRAVDLSLEELAAMGASAAREAAQRAYDAGLSVVGTVEFLEGDQVISSLAERSPSGAVTMIGAASTGESERPSDRTEDGKPAD